MTARPMTEEREAALARARRVIAENEPSAVSYTEPRRHETLLMAHALLSTSASERGMREALEGARLALEAAKIWLFDDSGTPIADETTRAMVNEALAALSGIEPGEDEQARGQGRSAPISTDTKGTTK